MIKISPEIYDHLYNYKIFTSFHDNFPAITVTYRIDGKKYGEDMPIDISYGSGGLKPIVEMVDYINFSKEMAAAWKVASKIVKHHRESKQVYNCKVIYRCLK